MSASKIGSKTIITPAKPSQRRKHSFSPKSIPREDTRLLAMAEDLVHLGSWQWDIIKPRAAWSREMFRIFGLDPRVGGLTMEEYQSFIHPDDLPQVSKSMQGSFFKSRLNQKTQVDYRIIRPDGEVRIIHSRRQIKEVTPEGKLKVIVGVDQDVTEQRQAEEALKRSEERFRVVAEAAHVAVYEIELKNRKIRYMSNLKGLTGYSPSETRWNLDWVLNHIHPDDRAHIKSTWQNAVADPNLDHYVLEYRFLHKNGDYVILKDTARVVKEPFGKAVLIIGGVRDITERRRDQEKIRQYNKHLEQLVAERSKQLVEYERFAAMGQVAGMVGHDIRNPLQALTGELYLIRMELSDIQGEETKNNISESLNSADENIGYINKIIADLQDYSRKLHPETADVNLDILFKEVFRAVKVPDKIQLSINIESTPKVHADPTFLRRALTNLINNAIQAMPDGGKLKVTGHQKNKYICITVADTGIGIDEESKTKLFTPLFTTKAKGAGVGISGC